MDTELDSYRPDEASASPFSDAEADDASHPTPRDGDYGSNRQLARNTLFNLVGQGAPLLVAAVAIPLLDEGLGTERYGLLLIAWMFLGYFSLFDLGLGRALTQLMADQLGQRRHAEVPALVWTALVLTLALGILGGVVLALMASWLAGDVLDLSAALQRDTQRALCALAAAVPFIVSTASLRGVLEARQRFDLVNAVRVPMGVFTFAGPLVVLPFAPTLLAVVLVLVAGRIAAWAAHAHLCLRILPGLRGRVRFDAARVRALLRFGGWMTVSNVISPLMVYMDRFLIGAVLSAAAVAYYATPWEVVTKLLIVPGALVAVLFPSFGYLQHRDAARNAQVFFTGTKLVAVALFPLALLAVAGARPGLELWLGPDYALQGTRPMQLLSIGVLLNGMANIPFAFVQGMGRPDVTAKIHALELPIYLVMLAVLLHAYGITGVALAWLLRAALDLLLLLLASRRLMPDAAGRYARVAVAAGGAAALLLLSMLAGSYHAVAPAAGLALVAYAGLTWTVILTDGEKDFLRARALELMAAATIR